MDVNSGTWDLPGLNFRNSNIGLSGNSSTPIHNYNSSLINTPVGRVYTSSAPPVPARPVRTNYGNSYNSYSSSFNSYGYNTPSFGSYGAYGCYGGYRPGFNSYGFGSGYYGNSYPENRFIQLAEESSRPTFQTIQSILHAFSSVTMMFESSFHAIYSSYMSVLGVADNFGKLRSVFSKILSTLAIFRTLGWIFRKFLYKLGLSKLDTKDYIWLKAVNEVSDVNSENKANKKHSWPLLLFMSMLIGGPLLLFKLMNELYPNPVPEIWVPNEQPGSLAVGLYHFQAASDQELSFSAQQKLMIAPKKYQPQDCPGWLLACNENKKIGLVPNNYIGVLMQSAKTGQTYIEHNGQTFQHPTKSLDNSKNSFNGNHEIFEDAASNIIKNKIPEDVSSNKTIQNENFEVVIEDQSEIKVN